MQYFPPALEKLVEQFARLPGIGRKTAQRLAFFVLSLPEEDAAAFADAIVGAKAAWAQSMVGTLTTSMSTSSATMLSYSNSAWKRPSSL